MKQVFLLCILFASVLLYYARIGLLAEYGLQIPLMIVLLVYLRESSRSSLVVAAVTGFMLDLHGPAIGPLTILLPLILLILNFTRETFIRTTGLLSRLTTITAGVFLYSVGSAAILMLINGFDYYTNSETVRRVALTFVFTAVVTGAVDIVLLALSRSTRVHAKRPI